jgi:hypothetical protein
MKVFSSDFGGSNQPVDVEPHFGERRMTGYRCYYCYVSQLHRHVRGSKPSSRVERTLPTCVLQCLFTVNHD